MFRREFLLSAAAAAFVFMKGTLLMAQDVTPLVASAEDTLVFELSTGGVIKIGMRPDKAPKHVERIKTLARQGFYNGTKFHRVIEDFMAQGGDPTGTGMGGSKLPDLPQEFNDLPHLRGTASMARTNDPNSANSQFFICFAPSPFLDSQYTVWGRVIEGMDAVDAIERGEPPANPTKITRAYVLADGPK
jgi:peptidylprolyl isomerase